MIANIDSKRTMYCCEEKDDTLGHNPYSQTDIIATHYDNYPLSKSRRTLIMLFEFSQTIFIA